MVLFCLFNAFNLINMDYFLEIVT